MENNNLDYEGQEKVAVLIDGAFYLDRAQAIFGSKSPEERADEVIAYCKRHLKYSKPDNPNILYRIFFYDCPPIHYQLFNPFTNKSVNMLKVPSYTWRNHFHSKLCEKRKVALRFGELQVNSPHFVLSDTVQEKLLKGKKEFSSLSEEDLMLNATQKGVDMLIGIDIASLAYKKLVSQIILIAGDSDFVPAAKLARCEGIDFILDPMWHGIKHNLNKHIDGKRSCAFKNPDTNDPLFSGNYAQ